MKKKRGKITSECCEAEVDFDISPDFEGDRKEDMVIGTAGFICKKCQKVCNIVIDIKEEGKNGKTRRPQNNSNRL